MLIARKIHAYMDENYGEKINRRHFIFGNVKPDIMRKFKTLRHSIHDSLGFVMGEIARHEYELETVKNPSVHLGMINHYMSDFFCSKHYYNDDGEGLIKHIKYEYRLHKKIKQMEDTGVLGLPYFKAAENTSGNFLDILRSLEEEYSNQPPSIETDIVFALCAPLAVCMFLLKNSAIEPEAIKQAA
jgi:hypothetical protein